HKARRGKESGRPRAPDPDGMVPSGPGTRRRYGHGTRRDARQPPERSAANGISRPRPLIGSDWRPRSRTDMAGKPSARPRRRPETGEREMRRLLWLGVGLAIGALAVRAATKKAQKLTPGGIADSTRESVGGLVDSVRTFVDDVRDGMTEREAQIHAAFAEGEVI